MPLSQSPDQQCRSTKRNSKRWPNQEQVFAVADKPARRAASRPSFSTQRWTLSVINGRRSSVELCWQHAPSTVDDRGEIFFSSPEFGTKFWTEASYFWRYLNSLPTQRRLGRRLPLHRKPAPPIYPLFRQNLWRTDGRTDRHLAIAYTANGFMRGGTSCSFQPPLSRQGC